MDQIKTSRARPRRSAAAPATVSHEAPQAARPEPKPTTVSDSEPYAAMIQTIRDEYEAIILDLLEELGRRPRKE